MFFFCLAEGVQVDIGVNSWNLQKTHQGLLQNAHAKFQPLGSIYRGDMRERNSNNKKNRSKKLFRDYGGFSSDEKSKPLKGTSRTLTTGKCQCIEQFFFKIKKEETTDNNPPPSVD